MSAQGTWLTLVRNTDDPQLFYYSVCYYVDTKNKTQKKNDNEVS